MSLGFCEKLADGAQHIRHALKLPASIACADNKRQKDRFSRSRQRWISTARHQQKQRRQQQQTQWQEEYQTPSDKNNGEKEYHGRGHETSFDSHRREAHIVGACPLHRVCVDSLWSHVPEAGAGANDFHILGIYLGALVLYAFGIRLDARSTELKETRSSRLYPNVAVEAHIVNLSLLCARCLSRHGHIFCGQTPSMMFSSRSPSLQAWAFGTEAADALLVSLQWSCTGRVLGLSIVGFLFSLSVLLLMGFWPLCHGCRVIPASIGDLLFIDFINRSDIGWS